MGMLRKDAAVSLTSDLPILFWRNIVTATNVGDNEQDPDFPASNVANPSTALKWKHDATDSPENSLEFFLIDPAGSSLVNYVAIAGHNFHTANIKVSINTRTSDSPQSNTPLIEPEIPPDDGPVIFLFDPRAGVEGIAIMLYQGTAPAEMAVVYSGTYTVLPEGIQGSHTPLPLATVSDVVTGKSESGAFLGRIVKNSGVVSTATIANFSKAWTRTELVPFLEFADEYPFFWAWSPTTYPNETAFAWLENDAQPSFDIDGYGEIDLSMRGLA